MTTQGDEKQGPHADKGEERRLADLLQRTWDEKIAPLGPTPTCEHFYKRAIEEQRKEEEPK